MLDPVANSIAVVVLIGMLVSIVAVGHRFLTGKQGAARWPAWALPSLVLAGLFVALYLSYIEISHSEAICGPVGNCNTVQQSSFATLFGILPVGIAGLLGYLGILLLWLLGELISGENQVISLILWCFTLIGTLFSLYLTFLEPFVIGASCMWCLSSAVILTVLFMAASQKIDLHQ